MAVVVASVAVACSAEPVWVAAVLVAVADASKLQVTQVVDLRLTTR